MPTLALNNFNILLTVLGGWISLFGLVSYLCKENFYLSEALISLLAGVAFSPRGANLIRPLEYTHVSLLLPCQTNPVQLTESPSESQVNLDTTTLYFSRLVLGVQLVLAGVQLPSRYLRTQWRPLALLLGPIMTAMWLTTSLLVWALVPSLPFLHALAIGACVAPTDPVLSNVIVKGKFADHNVPKELQRIIIAESGANDGLGYPFLFLALYLIKYVGTGAAGVELAPGGPGMAVGLWFGETWGYTILLSVVYGAVVGWIAKELLHWAEERKYVDRESFLVFAFSLALFITGTCGLIGSDDVLACFIAGNTFTWDDWFRLETLDDSLQPTIDMLLNVSIFMWYGAVCPWDSFLHNDVVPLPRLVAIGILVLVFRRLPWVFAIHKKIPQIEQVRQAVFVGFFGPVGVSAVFYLYITNEFLETLHGSDGELRADVAKLPEAVTVVVWFLCICSVVVHGLSIPFGKLGYNLPRTLSRTVTDEQGGGSSAAPFHLGSRVNSIGLRLPTFTANNTPAASRRNSISAANNNNNSSNNGENSGATAAGSAQPPAATTASGGWRIGGSVIREAGGVRRSGSSDGEREREIGYGTTTPVQRVFEPANRTIRFPDENA